jgi:hypothetical protein
MDEDTTDIPYLKDGIKGSIKPHKTENGKALEPSNFIIKLQKVRTKKDGLNVCEEKIEQLRRKLDKIKKLNRLKKSLIFSIVHKSANYLTVAKGYLSLLKRHFKTEESIKYINYVSRALDKEQILLSSIELIFGGKLQSKKTVSYTKTMKKDNFKTKFVQQQQ